MKKTFENATRVLAITAALATAAPEAAVANQPQPSSIKQAKAIKLARQFTKDLYNSTDFPKGVPVPGVLNGYVKFNKPVGSTTGFDHPIILVESHSQAKTSKNEKLLNGTWIGIPSSNAEGQVVIEPVQIHLGNQGGETESLQLQSKHNPILEGAGIYLAPAPYAANDLMGFDIQGTGNYPDFQIKVDGNK